MELKIINKKEDPLLFRTKVESEMVFEKATPSIEEVKNELVKVLGKDGKLIVVKGIYTMYGLKKAKNVSYVYENEETLKRIEIKNKKKTGKKEKKEAKEKPAEKPKEQAEKEKPQKTKEEPKKEAKQKEPVKAKK